MSKEDKKAKRRKKALFYRIGFPLVKLFHGRQKVLYEEAVDQGEPVIFVANHAQAFGPISMIVNFDRTVRPWIAADVMFKETAVDFVFVQFFAGNIKKHKRWNMFKAQFVGRALVAIFANVGGIPVYFDRRLIKTMSDSVAVLEGGEPLVIFGETPKRFSPYVAEISDGFPQVAHMYYKKTGKRVRFCPVYIAPKYISVGRATEWNPDADVKAERRRVAEYLRDNILRLAEALPEHKPIPTYTEEYFAAIEAKEREKAEHTPAPIETK